MSGRHIIEWQEFAVTLGNPGLPGLGFWAANGRAGLSGLCFCLSGFRGAG